MNVIEEPDGTDLGPLGAVEPLTKIFSLITLPKPLVI
jgi:hypothetical protein